ncbi:hypothetical protein Ancab_017985 [Ancistrocladus abbreviatus]
MLPLTDGSVLNTLVITNCDIIKPRVAAAEHISQFNEEARSPFVKKYKTIVHPGEVLVWDVESQPNRHAVLGASPSHPDLVSQIFLGSSSRTCWISLCFADALFCMESNQSNCGHLQILTGHQENVEFALAMCAAEPYVLSGGRNC